MGVRGGVLGHLKANPHYNDVLHAGDKKTYARVRNACLLHIGST